MLSKRAASGYAKAAWSALPPRLGLQLSNSTSKPGTAVCKPTRPAGLQKSKDQKKSARRRISLWQQHSLAANLDQDFVQPGQHQVDFVGCDVQRWHETQQVRTWRIQQHAFWS